MKKLFIKIMVGILTIQAVGLAVLSDSNVYAADSKTTNNIAILIEFEDLTSTSLDSENVLKNAEILLNDDGSSSQKVTTALGNMPITSLKKLIRKYSYGTKDIQTTFFPQNGQGTVISYTAEHPRSYYLKNGENGYGNDNTEMLKRRKELLDGALESAKASIEGKFTADDLDKDGDGYVDAVTFFVEGDSYLNDNSNVLWKDLLWSHQGKMAFSTKLQNKSVYTYSMINTYNPTGTMGAFSLNRSGYGTILHEYMHVLGLPDLYRGYSTGSPVGQYDLMGNVVNFAPQGLLSYHLSDELGWSQPLKTISSSQTITLTKPQYQNSSEMNAVKLVSAFNSQEMIVAEYYDSDDYAGATDTASQDGLLLYRVKTDQYNGNINGSSGTSQDQIYIYRPEESAMNAGDGDISKAILRDGTDRVKAGKNISETKGYDKDALYYSNGDNSGIVVEIVKQDEKSITIDVKMPTAQGTGTESNPYLITTTSDLDLLKTDSSSQKKYYKLMNDIDFKGATLSSFDGLYGQLDGNGYAIKNAVINGAGFFTQIQTNAVLKNLTLTNIKVQFTGNGYAGVVTGANYGKISNVHIVGGSVTGNNARNTGGIAGTIGNVASIIDSSTSADVLSSHGGNGGIVGLYQGNDGYYSGGIIQNVFVSGKVVQGTDASGAAIASLYNQFEDGDVQNIYFDKKATGLTNGSGNSSITGIYSIELLPITDNFVSQKQIDLNQYYITTGQIKPTFSVQNKNIATVSENRLIMQNAGSTQYNAIVKLGNNSYTITASLSLKAQNMSIVANGFTGTYDGKAHTISLAGVASGSTIKYRTSSNGTWTTAKPTRTSAGTTTVYYQITNPNYNTVSGSAKISISRKSVSKLTISKISNRTYTGKQIKPGITVKDGNKTLKKGTHYTLSYGKNKSTGKGYVKITGKGNYTGTLTKYFYIVPKKPSVRVKAGAGKITVTSKTTGASGYQIAYSRSKNKGFKTVTAKSSKTITKLSRKKAYYIKVRAYKVVDGKKVYGSYSSVKMIKTK